MGSDTLLTENKVEYGYFLEIIEKYLASGFKGMGDHDQLLTRVNGILVNNRQYFYIADMLKLQILYTSPSFEQVLGFPRENMDPGFQFKGTHPDDQRRHSMSRARMFQLCHDMYVESAEEPSIMSTNFRFQHADGHYVNALVQGYSFVAPYPIRTTYCLFVTTDIDWFGPIKHGYNFYFGNDVSYFRYPDEELILTGCIFTEREFEIIKLIRDGLDSNAIGEKLFISSHTVDTHRRNILKKTGYHSVTELIIDLQKQGFF
jgi:DNA-binding CsgD family transcriptional regulator